jgi:hypothetical protein
LKLIRPLTPGPLPRGRWPQARGGRLSNSERELSFGEAIAWKQQGHIALRPRVLNLNKFYLTGENINFWRLKMGRDKSYAEIINSAKVMIAGLKSNGKRVARRGISADFTSKLEELQVTAMSLDNEQEDLKAELKTKTAELDSKIDGILKMMSEAKKAVKLEMEKEAWKSFGIQDSK